MKHQLKGIIIGVAAVLAAVALMGASYSRGQFGARQLEAGTLTVNSTSTLTGAVTAASTLAVTGDSTLSGAIISPFDAVSVTSPTATASVAGKTVISLTTNVSQTNFALTGGIEGQVVIVRGTSDSATSTFADGQSSMTLTADAALGLNDTLTLLCTSADGDEWAEVSRALN